VAYSQLEEVDRFILARYAQLAEHTLDGYEAYDYSTICQAVNAFTTVDLSAFYADVTKDRVYTFAARSRERRSAQTTMYIIADGLTRLLAPILSFTTDELWRYLPGPREESVHLALFPVKAELSALQDAELVERWTRLMAIRSRVLAEIEPLRSTKQIGSSLQAKVILSADPAELGFLQQHLHHLPMLFIVSEVELRPAREAVTDEPAGPAVTIERAGGTKCERCWRYVSTISTEPAWAGLCERCQEALAPGDQAA
jgi:isoleucyl-tRNA synthetase